jgi:CubicO group peptidase (beta-lactamase class C family)
MKQLISRRKLLSNGIRTGAGLWLMKELSFGSRPVLVFSKNADQADQFQPAFQKFDEFIARHMNDIGAPGMTVAVVNRGGLLRESHYGFADLKTGAKVGTQTLFEIGSISKSFVAIALMQLVDEGKLDLQKPVSTYLPWLKVDSKFKPFTTHHLLSHTSGLSAVPLLMRVAATTLSTGFEPGSRFVYSNIGYVLLGFILEAVDKRPFAESLKKRVLDPLGMSASASTITNDIRERMAVGYRPLQDDRPFPRKGQLGEAPWLEVPEAAGSVAATAKDMGNYLRMLLNRGAGSQGQVLSEKAFDLLTHPVIKAPFRGEEASYGYGLWTSDVNGHTLLRHTGGMIAFSSAMYADTTDGLAAFASVNASLGGGYRPVSVTRYALDVLSAAAHGTALPALPPPPPAVDVVKNAAEYAGTYTSANGGKKLVLKNQAEKLILEYNGREIVLELAGRDRFIVKDPELELFPLGFGRDKDQVVEAFNGSEWWTNERYTGAKTFDYPKEWEAYTGNFRSDSPWYGSTRLVIRKGRLLIGGEQPLVEVEPGIFRPEGDNTADKLVFDTTINGKAVHLNLAGLDFYRTFTR